MERYKLSDFPKVASVTVVPLNGFANRLQALSSGFQLAQDLETQFFVHWKTENIFPLDYNEVFHSKFIENFSEPRFASTSEIDVICNSAPIGTGVNGNILTVRGGVSGEQVHMQKIIDTIKVTHESMHIIVISGGLFCLPGSEVNLKNRILYSQVSWAESITVRVEELSKNLPPVFNGLHLRYSDRKHEAPTSRKILKSVVQYTNKQPLLLFSEDAKNKEKYFRLLSGNNVEVLVLPNVNFNRSTKIGIIDAIAEFLIMGKSQNLISFKFSSYPQESFKFHNPRHHPIITIPPNRIRLIIHLIRNFIYMLAIKLLR